MRAKVSVIIPCYRCADTIERAVASVMAQTLLPEEIILIDDFSDDDGETLAVLAYLRQKFGEQVPIVIILQENNGGPGAARNAGWEKASQSYIAFLDADDAWHPKKLEIQYAWMISHPEVTLSGHDSMRLPPGRKKSDIVGEARFHFVNSGALLLSNRFPARSVMLKRGVPFRFEPKKRFSEDYLLWLFIVLSGTQAAFIEMPLAFSYKSDFGESGLTKSLWQMEKGELDTYCRIRRQGYISSVSLIGLALFSMAKFARRLALKGLGNLSMDRRA